MTKEEIRKLVLDYGDAIITFRSQQSNKLKYNVCTLDFSNDYIKTKVNKSEETDETIKMFCWDADSFRLIRPENVTSVQALNSVLRRANSE